MYMGNGVVEAEEALVIDGQGQKQKGSGEKTFKLFLKIKFDYREQYALKQDKSKEKHTGLKFPANIELQGTNLQVGIKCMKMFFNILDIQQ